MTAVAKTLGRVPEPRLEIETLKMIALFCGIGLVVSLFLAANGLAMSPDFWIID